MTRQTRSPISSPARGLTDDPTYDGLRKLAAMDGVLVYAAPPGEAVIGERPVHGLDDVVALAEFL